MYRKYSQTITLGLVMVAVFLLMGLLNGQRFFQLETLQSMAFQLPDLGILALAQMPAMLTGGINLSIIYSGNLAGIVTALILTRVVGPEMGVFAYGSVILLAICAGLLISAIIGFLNGFLIAKVGVSPILATLGTMTFSNGAAIVLTRGYPISGLPKPFLFIAAGQVLGIPVPIIIFVLCAGAMALVLNRTPLGFNMYMIGSNPTACRFSGVNNEEVLIRTYLISGLYAGIAALIMVSRFNSAKAGYGESYLLVTVLASVLGGISASGGFGTVSGLVIALVILQIVSSGLNLLGISAFLSIAMWGLILILVMVVNHVVAQRQAKGRTVREQLASVDPGSPGLGAAR